MNYESNRELEMIKSKNLKDYALSVCGGKEEKLGKQTVINPCPLCGHKDDFMIYERTNTYRSYGASCKSGGSIIDFEIARLGLHNNKEGQTEAIKSLKKHFNIVSDFTPSNSTKPVQKNQQEANRKDKKEEPEEKQDFSSLIDEWSRNAGETDYFLNRGLTAETIERFKLGYSEKGKFAFSKTFNFMIPITSNFIIYRNADRKGQRYYNAGEVELLNAEHIKNKEAQTIFIVEGAFDCMSIEQQGFNAIALNSTSNKEKLLKLLEEHKTEQGNKQYIFIPDKDEQGQKFIKQMEEGFSKIDIPLYVEQLPEGTGKDCNDYLIKDEKAFKTFLKGSGYLKNNTANHIQAFIDGIAGSVNTPAIPTGFNNLDTILDGGLYEGLYIVGAISSLGKTTFVLQIADQIAQQGQDVLIFSLEMARSELMAKSISRLTFTLCDNTRDAKTTRGITAGKRHSRYSQQERELINNSIKAYSEYAKNIYISEGLGNIGVMEVRKTVNEHIRITGRKPIVIIDYLQILAPFDTRSTDKQNTDKAVMELKRISRDYKIPVIGISSFNRENYNTAVSMTAFKESGAIEYSSDVLIGLQFQKQREIDETNRNKPNNAPKLVLNLDEEKSRDPRKIELKILKNRNGETGKSIDFEYYPLFNFFEEDNEGRRVFGG